MGMTETFLENKEVVMTSMNLLAEEDVVSPDGVFDDVQLEVVPGGISVVLTTQSSLRVEGADRNLANVESAAADEVGIGGVGEVKDTCKAKIVVQIDRGARG